MDRRAAPARFFLPVSLAGQGGEDIRTALLSHPLVSDAVVTTRREHSGELRVIAYVVARYRTEEAGTAGRRVSHWERVWSEAYRVDGTVSDPAFNIAGWNSSYTQAAIPVAEMRDWVDATIARIARLELRRIWEIGCGTGLLMSRLLPGATAYRGTDVSDAALVHVRAATRNDPRVVLEQRRADDFQGIPAGEFDGVILNSVAQYFPGAEYLARVVEGASRAVREGGTLFLGDIRNLALRDAYQLSVELFKAPPSLDSRDLLARFARERIRQNELFVDPAFFLDLRGRIPAIRDVRLLLKRGRYRNEMTTFRYDAVLEIGTPHQDMPDPEWRDWRADGLSVAKVATILEDGSRDHLAFSAVPNRRTAPFAKALSLLRQRNAPATVGELRTAIHAGAGDGVDPEDLFSLAEGHAYEVEVLCGRSGQEGDYDVLLWRRGTPRPRWMPRWHAAQEGAPPDRRHRTNDPLHEETGRAVVPEIVAFLRDRLPRDRMPSALVLMDELPRTATGELDEATLPPPARGELLGLKPRAPLSYAQARLWFLERFDPERALYNLARQVDLRGSLRVHAFCDAIAATVRRHDVLRSSVQADDREPFVEITEDLEWSIPIIDLRGLEPDRREALETRLRREDVHRAFDFDTAPLARARLVCCEPTRHALLLTLHHLICDAWSFVIFVREVAAHYDSSIAGRPASLTSVTGYSAFAREQRTLVNSNGFRAKLERWKGRLDGIPAALDLPLDRPRPAVRTYAGRNVRFRLDRELSGRLIALGRVRKSTPFMMLLAAFQALLAKSSGGTDVCVGVPVAGRNRKELEAVIGMFLNTTVFRSKIDAETRFDQLLDLVRSWMLDTWDDQDVPFERLVEELALSRDLSLSPIFQTFFSFDSSPTTLPPTSSGLELTFRQDDPEVALFDLSIRVSQEHEGMAVLLQYNTALFDETTARRLQSAFESLLRSIAERPDARIHELRIDTDAERHQLAREWNDTRDAPAAAPFALHELVLRQATLSPDSVALAQGDEQLTFAELDRRSGLVARAQAALGAGPDTIVVVLSDRTVNVIVTLLGVLRCGAAYLPLDPGFPQARLTMMLEDSEAPLLLVDESAAGLPASTTHPVSSGEPLASFQDQQLAYLLYTSGSTGRPKGVAVAHANVTNFVHALQQRLGVANSDVLLSVTTLSFDIAVLEIFVPLMSGARVVLADRATVSDGERLKAAILEHRPTIMQATPAAWHLLIAAGWEDALPRDRLCGGEALPPDLGKRLAKGGTAWNMYGPTETTVWSAMWRVESSPISIGRPIANTRVYVTDATDGWSPIGIIGELAIAGRGVARGYLDRPSTTASRFVPESSAAPSLRMYRTGDLARWFPDGRLECLGRLDNQVKIRGHRIELGEIESELVACGAREAVVVLHAATNGNERLIAFVTLNVLPADGSGADDLRERLHSRIPRHMVPASIVVLDDLPRTPNGKIDRRSLPLAGAPVRIVAASPEGTTERVLASAWEELLGIQGIARHDDFFSLGGHSLLAVRLVSRLREALGITVPLRMIFEHRTLAGLSAALSNLESKPSEKVPSLVRLSGEEFPLSFQQERLWVLDRLSPGNPAYNLVQVLRVAGRLRASLIEAAFDHAAHMHPGIRAVFPTTDLDPVQRIDGPPPPFGLVDLQSLVGTQRTEVGRRLLVEQSVRLPNLGTGPIAEMRLIRTAPEEGLLATSVHHIACDDWSMGLLSEDIRRGYECLRQGVPLPANAGEALRYVDVAAWQRGNTAALQHSLAYWKKRLSGVPPRVSIPADHPRPAQAGFRGDRMAFSLDETRLADLNRTANRHGCTLFMLLLSGLATIVTRLSGEEDVVVGSPVAGRSRPEFEPIVGFFANVLALRTSLAGNPTFEQLLARVRETVIEGQEHPDVPFDRIVEALQPRRDPSQHPIFQIMFVLQGVAEQETRLPDARLQPTETPGSISRFDLTLVARRVTDGLRVTIDYSRDLFERKTIEEFADRYQRILTRAVAGADWRIWDVGVLDASEEAWIRAAEQGPVRSSAPELFCTSFARRARLDPDAIAVRDGTQYVTFHELECRTRHLAGRIRVLGGGPATVVGVHMRRSADLLIALVAVLRSGAAWLPLDPSYPSERLNWMLEDSGTTVLLVDGETATAALGLDLVRVRADDRPATEETATVIDCAGSDDLAYAIYTSGSTGRPKGALLTHGGLAQYLDWCLERYPRGGWSPVHMSISFDATITSLFPALLTGGTVRMIPESAGLGGLAAVLQSEGPASTVKLTPAHLSILAEQLRPDERRRAAEAFIIGGESLAGERIAEWRSAAPALELVNEYGPTETVVGCTVHTAGDLDVRGPVPIGRPISRARNTVEDAFGNSLPCGAPGELLIGGPGVATGYLDRAALTAARFVPDPAGVESRRYRSGDLTRRRRDGILEFLGRIDSQVKIRGHRIEIGEIEAVLREISGVQESCVVVRTIAGEPQLVAWVVPSHGVALLPQHVKDVLAARLPEPLVPKFVRTVATLAMTSNGKIDRAVLQDTAVDNDHIASEQPRTRMERELLRIWREVLQDPALGIDDNFFGRGGHSLHLVRAHARSERELGIDLPIQETFRFPTVRLLAARLADGESPMESDAQERAAKRRTVAQRAADRERQRTSGGSR